MQIIRYHHDQTVDYGVVVDGQVHEAVGDLSSGFQTGSEVGALADLRLAPPCEPTKILCIGRNYAAHIKEMKRDWPTQPFMFLKTPNTIVGPDDEVVRPRGAERFHYEGELAVVIGRTASRVDADDWRDYVAGYTCANDFTVREWQENDGQWTRAKSADTLCPIGPWIVTDVENPESLRLRTMVNGEVRQDSTTADFVFGIGEMLAFITATITLVPGDLLLTGTPGGVGGVATGDVVDVELEGIGTLRNRVADSR